MSQNQSSTKSSRQAEAQLERLFDLLPDDLFETVRGLPYASRALIERWHLREADRLAPLMSRVVGGAQHIDLAVVELLDLLAAEQPDIQLAGSWLSKHRDEISAQLLTQLVSAAMSRGVVNLMSQRGKTKSTHTTTRLQKLGKRWLQLEAEGHNKSKAAETLADEFHLGFRTVYNYLAGDVDVNHRIFPNGANAEREALGLPLQ